MVTSGQNALKERRQMSRSLTQIETSAGMIGKATLHLTVRMMFLSALNPCLPLLFRIFGLLTLVNLTYCEN